MNKNKQLVLAKIKLLKNLKEVEKQIEDEIVNYVSKKTVGTMHEVDERAKRMAGHILDGMLSIDESPKIMYTMFEDAGLLEGFEDGEEYKFPHIEYTEDGFSILCPDKENEMMAYLSVIDDDTIQSGTCLRTKDYDYLDLTMSEIKKGDLAVSAGKAEDNHDIDIMTWTDPSSEDYTNKDTVKYEDIAQALELDGEERE